jgi:hypothetical protein
MIPDGKNPLWKVLEFLMKLVPFARKEKRVRLTIFEEDLCLRRLLRLIQQRTSIQFFCEQGILTEATRTVTMAVKDATVEEILKIALAAQPEEFVFSKSGSAIFIQRVPRIWETP